MRPHVLRELAALGLTATVRSTGDHEPIGQHDGALSGLVMLHAPGREPSWPSTTAGPHEEAYRQRMAAAHGLRPIELERSLRGFVGQHAPYRRPEWLDHARTWVDPQGAVVLSAEPYGHVFEDALRIVHDLNGLPLTVERHGGVWAGTTVLLLLRYDHRAEPLPAIYEAAPDPPTEAEQLLAASLYLGMCEADAVRLVRSTTDQPTAQAIRAMVAAVLAADEIDRHGLLKWLASKLSRYVVAGHITAAAAEQIIVGTVRASGCSTSDEVVLDLGWRRCHTAMLADVGAEEAVPTYLRARNAFEQSVRAAPLPEQPGP